MAGDVLRASRRIAQRYALNPRRVAFELAGFADRGRSNNCVRVEQRPKIAWLIAEAALRGRRGAH